MINRHPSPYVIGIDEVGYGSGAGPLVVVGVTANKLWKHDEARDSKKVPPSRRRRAYGEFLGMHSPDALAFVYVASAEPDVVDALGVYTACRKLTVHVAQTLYAAHQCPVVLDGEQSVLIPGIPAPEVVTLPSSEDAVAASGAASVIAKVFRDNIMVDYDRIFPGYGFKKNKGYLTEAHLDGICIQGPSPIHRFSYKNIRRVVVESQVCQYRPKLTEMRVWTSYLLPQQLGQTLVLST